MVKYFIWDRLYTSFGLYFEQEWLDMNKVPSIAIYHRRHLTLSKTFIFRQIVGLRRYEPVIFTDKVVFKGILSGGDVAKAMG